MRKLLLIAGLGVLSLAGFGCKKGGDADKIISEYSGFKDRLCKCADKACADKVTQESEAWMAKQVEAMSKTKPTKEQDAKFDKIEDEMEACAKKFSEAAPAEGGAEGATPPAEGATPPAEGATPPAEGATPPAEGGEKPATP